MAREILGTIEELWRYPVSSLGGERLTSAEIGTEGLGNDRRWCVVDTESGQPAAPEKDHRWRPALFLDARMRDDRAEIGFPDGEWVSMGDRQLAPKLSEHFGFSVAVRAYDKAGAGISGNAPTATNRYAPSPVHLITTGSLDHLSSQIGDGGVESRRFRPTVLLRTPAHPDFRERAWIGQTLQIGSAVLKVVEETKRCGMTLIPQPGLPENADILRSILRQNRRNFGIYCAVLSPGTLSPGDSACRDTP